MPDLVMLGETMAALVPDRIGPLRYARHMGLAIAGSESTVAIGVSRLGHTAAWIGRLGDDEFGRFIRTTLQGEGVSVQARTDSEAPTGLMFKERRTGDTRRVHYYRAGSAGSRLEPADLPSGLIESAKILHVSAITPALSPGAADTTAEAIRRADFVSFDANFRSRLWSASAYQQAVLELLPRVDLLFAGLDEARILLRCPDADPRAAAEALRTQGPDTVVVTMGRSGAVAVDATGSCFVDAEAVAEVDPVGAGDSFVAGYLSALLTGAEQAARLRNACRTAAFSVSAEGDWEGLPTAAELSAASSGDIIR